MIVVGLDEDGDAISAAHVGPFTGKAEGERWLREECLNRFGHLDHFRVRVVRIGPAHSDELELEEP